MSQEAPSSSLRPHDEGIVASSRPQGWLGRRWNGIFDDRQADSGGRLVRGRTFARGGRVRDLWLSPGLASAEVVDGDQISSTLRIEVLENTHWSKVIAALQQNLAHLAAMVEGRLPEELVTDLAAHGIELVPRKGEIGGDCDCGDYIFPCTHLAALHYVLADALDGDPFLLFTLRGRTREQLIDELCTRWSDPPSGSGAAAEPDEPAPTGSDWFASPVEVSRVRFTMEGTPRLAAGLHALGPVPGGVDLERTLGSLYQAGAEAAVDIALQDAPAPQTEGHPRWEGQPPSVRKPRIARRVSDFETDAPRGKAPPRSHKATALAAPSPSPSDIPGEEDLITERMVDLIAELECARSQDLADRLELPPLRVRRELVALEKLGIVVRTGQTRGTRWWLG